MSLRRFVMARVLSTIPVLFGVSIITFGLIHLTPGDVVDLLLATDPDAQPGEAERLRQEFGLADPVYVQYIDWITGILQGDFGETFNRGPSVDTLIWGRMPETIAIGIFGWVFALVIAIPTGIYAAVRRNKLGDDVSRFIALSGISIPNFWLGLMIIAILALQLDLFPVLPPGTDLTTPEMWWYLVMPGITIGTAASANLMRIMRTSMAEEINKEYVTAARAKGLPERRIILKHVLRNSLISVTTVAAFLTASIISGSVVVEVVFSWPGIGELLISAINGREVNLIMGITLLFGVAIVIANLLADIMYAVLDPRIRGEY